ncbi:MAG: hypothetical protein K2N44_04560 [Lachnospiraceae bacterium]|nr:hypothetical protein [Lachnospiraceae bacterium]
MADALKEWKGLNGIAACRTTVEENDSVTTGTSYAIFSGSDMTAEKCGWAREYLIKVLETLSC